MIVPISSTFNLDMW